MKMFKKSDCSVVNGYVVSDNEIVFINSDVYEMITKLEEGLQKAEYLLAQDPATPVPSLDGFKMKSNFGFPTLPKPKTPAHDKQAKQALAIMAETDAVNETNKINELIEDFVPLFEFVTNDYIIESETQHGKIDTPVLGNILTLDTGVIVEAITKIVKAHEVY